MKFVILIAFATLQFGCATDTGNANKDRNGRVTNAILAAVGKAVGSVVVSTITNAATQEINGKKVDFAQAASKGLWTNTGSIINSSTVESVINAWSGDQIKPVAAMAAAKFKEVNPQTPEEKQAVVATIATAISDKAK